jgi:hypothetical protein
LLTVFSDRNWSHTSDSVRGCVMESMISSVHPADRKTQKIKVH